MTGRSAVIGQSGQKSTSGVEIHSGVVRAVPGLQQFFVDHRADKTCYIIEQGLPWSTFIQLNMERDDTIADALNSIQRANLRGVATTDIWRELVEDYFVLREEDESEGSIDDGPPDDFETPGSEEDDGEQDAELIIIDPMVKIADEEEERCRNFR